MANTLEYYNRNAKQYVHDTVGCGMEETIEQFLAELGKEQGTILDFGCGSGRDSKVFLSKGYDTVSADGSEEICRHAEIFLSKPVVHMLFTELQDEDQYDGIWACASLLHLPYMDLVSVMKKIAKALKSDGVLYVSFRYGDMEGLRGERYFTDMTETKLDDVIAKSGLKVVKTWVSEDKRIERLGDTWLNAILRKC